MEYDDFLDEPYEPGGDDLVCTFRVAPGEGLSVEAVADGESLESQAADVPELATAPEKWGTGTPRRRRCGTGRLDRWLALSVVGL